MSKKFGFDKLKSNFEIKNKTAVSAEINIYGQIGQDWWGDGITAKSISDRLAELPNDISQLDIRINSVGGDVFDGITIYNRILQFKKATKTVYIDGLAASIASIIALAGDEIIYGEGTFFMVHKPWTYTAGNSNDLETTIRRLDDIENQMLGIYSRKSKKSKEEIKSLLHGEDGEGTWMTAEQAIEFGFGDKISGEAEPIAASIMDHAKWMRNRPVNIISDKVAAKASINKTIKNIEEFSARK